MKIISFNFLLTDESRPNFYLRTFALFGYQRFKPILLFFSVSRQNSEAFRGHPGPRTDFLRYLDFLRSHIGICHPQRVWFLRFFGLKTSINFVHFGLDSGMVYGETAGV